MTVLSMNRDWLSGELVGLLSPSRSRVWPLLLGEVFWDIIFTISSAVSELAMSTVGAENR